MKNITKIFFDLEFTGLHKNTTPVSIGIVTDTNKKFYAEFNDYDKSQCDEWINKNVIDNLLYNDYFHYLHNDEENNTLYIKNDFQTIKQALKDWLNQFKQIEFWGDCVFWDWFLMVDLIMEGNTMRKPPKNFTTAQPFDIFTLLKTKGINPKEKRHVLLDMEKPLNQHNSLYDAEITKKIYEKYG